MVECADTNFLLMVRKKLDSFICLPIGKILNSNSVIITLQVMFGCVD